MKTRSGVGAQQRVTAAASDGRALFARPGAQKLIARFLRDEGRERSAVTARALPFEGPGG